MCRNDLGLIGTLIWIGFIGSEVNFELDGGNGNLIAGKQCSANDFLAVDPCTVTATEVSQKEKSIGFYNDAVNLGNAAVIQVEVAQLTVSPHDRDITIESDGFTPCDRYQLCQHGCSSGMPNPAEVYSAGSQLHRSG